MRINLSEDYIIENNYGNTLVLIRVGNKVNKDTGKMRVDKNLGYFATVDQALEQLVRWELNASDLEFDSLRDYIDEYKAVTDRVEAIVAGVRSETTWKTQKTE